MTLDEYLKSTGETGDAFAKRIGRATSTVTRLRNGDTKPDWDTIQLILEHTGGQVKPNDYIGLSSGNESAV